MMIEPVRYRRRRSTIEAVEVTRDNVVEVVAWLAGQGRGSSVIDSGNGPVALRISGFDHVVFVGDLIVVTGGLRRMRRPEFDAEYEPVSPPFPRSWVESRG